MAFRLDLALPSMLYQPPRVDPMDGRKPPYQEVSARKIAERDAKIPRPWILPADLAIKTNVLDIPKTCRILSDAELNITETPAPDLLCALRSGSLTSEEVTTAFCKRAAIAHQVTNCLTTIMFEEGIAAAKLLDQALKLTGKPVGPLHGLPVSLKDCFEVQGYPAAIGFACLTDQKVKQEDPNGLPAVLRNAGAVLYCKTNVPTGMMMAETYNNVWGYTANPAATTHSAGGSSGGEGALLAMRGSPLGVGTDIGGSIRIPSAANGLFGLKSAGGRFTNIGHAGDSSGQEALHSVIGPLAKDAQSLEIWCKAVLAACPWESDPSVHNIPWREISLPTKLAFAVTRALRETRAALEKQGHVVVEWTLPDPDEVYEMLMGFFFADGGRAMLGATRCGPVQEPLPAGMKEYQDAYEATKDQLPTVSGSWKLQQQRREYLLRFWASWTGTKEVSTTGRAIDGLISPVTPFPTCPRYKFTHALYTAVWNMANLTSCAFPAGEVQANDTIPTGVGLRPGEEAIVWENYDVGALVGVPIGLQMVTMRHEEEKAIKLATLAYDSLATWRQSSA